MNKHDKHYIDVYFNTSDNYGVRSIYKNPSIAKMEAEMRILQRMKKDNGYGYKALSGNCMTFVAAYITDSQLKVFTKAHMYVIDLPEEYL